MAFPTSPTNGQTVVVNNITYQYANTTNSWTRLVSTANVISANTVTANTLNISTLISVTGNITGNYILGNGSLLTGISTNPSNITSGTSNVTVVSSGGNVTIGVGGTGNVAVFATTGEYVTGVVSASGNVTGSNLLTGGAISATGTLSVTGATTLGTASTGNLSAGNVLTGGLISAAGNITGGNLSGTSIAGTLTTAAQPNITSVGTLTSLTVSGNATSGNLLTGGLISATGNITGGNLLTAGLISATGNITGNYFIGNGSLLTGISGGGGGANIANGTSNVTVVSSGGNVTVGVGGTSNVAVFATTGEYVTGLISASGNITGGNVISGGVRVYKWTTQANTAPSGAVPGDAWYDSYAAKLYLYINDGTGNQWVDQSPPTSFDNLTVSGTLSAVGNITGNYFIGNGSQLTGIVSSYGNANVVANLAALGSNPVSTTGNVTAGYFAGNGSLLTSITGANVTGTVANATYATTAGSATSATTAGTVTSNAQANITSVGTLTSLAVTANVTGGNLLTSGLVSAAGTITGTSHLGAVVSVTANVTGGNILTAGIISATGNIITTGNIVVSGGFYDTGDHLVTSTAANANIVLTPTGTGITQNNGAFSASGNVTGGNILTGGLMSSTGNAVHANVIINGTAALGSGVLIVSGNIQTSTANATANIGNASNYFNRLFAQATTALYADLAEVYKADAQYPPGTVLVFGGTQEVTTSTDSHDARIAGVVSTNPAHVMNSGMTSEFTVEVGLIGRVPCQVIGPIAAGDRVVSSNRAGVAERLDMSKYQPGVIIGKALESYLGSEPSVIEVVVGRL